VAVATPTAAAVAVTTTAATAAAVSDGDTGSIEVDFRTMPLRAAIAMPADLRGDIEAEVLGMFGVKLCVMHVDGKRWSVITSEVDNAIAWIKNPRCCTGVLTIQTRLAYLVPMVQPRVSADIMDLYNLLGVRTCVVEHAQQRGLAPDEFTLVLTHFGGMNSASRVATLDRNEPPRLVEVACTPFRLPGAHVNFLPPVLRTLARLCDVKYISVQVPGKTSHMVVRLDAAAVVAKRLGLEL
jgi:hypothetical protein